MIHSDWHIHTDASYDARLPLEQLIADARAQGLRRIGITDHLNYNNDSFWGNIRQSVENFRRLARTCPELRLGVELTPISQPLYDHIALTGDKSTYVPPVQDEPYGIALAATKEELIAAGIQYAIGAAHWRVDVADENLRDSAEAQIKEWHRQQMYLACDRRVTILGHPWSCNRLWYGDFTVIPASMHDELAAALLENGKYAECNGSMFYANDTSDYFRHQYAQFLRFLFERGIPITYGSDCHGYGRKDPIGSAHPGTPLFNYPDRRQEAWHYLEAAGFRDGDFSELPEEAFWQ